MELVNRHRVTDMHVYMYMSDGTHDQTYNKVYVKKCPFTDGMLYIKQFDFKLSFIEFKLSSDYVKWSIDLGYLACIG